MSSTLALEARDLAARRGSMPLWRDVSFAVPWGSALLVRGANGTGKTTLLRIVAGLTHADAGVLCWRGAPCAPFAPPLRDDLLFVGHAPALSDELTAAENLAALASLGGDDASAAAVRSALDLLDIGRAAGVLARALSAGQRRRVLLARLALSARRLWVLDEPTTSLDDGAVAWFEATLAAHLARGGVAVVATHLPLRMDAARRMELVL
ncbi:MAG: cytochrome c biogenesis heme-transporting ATPase CcmA [Proteobacteria bacterium]|nr:cytochrome c biogenesis heme-transporting ATPase CcmA [Pseudomonadota bacterium]